MFQPHLRQFFRGSGEENFLDRGRPVSNKNQYTERSSGVSGTWAKMSSLFLPVVGYSLVSHEDFQGNFLSNGRAARAAPYGHDWALQVRCEIDTRKPLRLISALENGKRSWRPRSPKDTRGALLLALPRDAS